MKCPNCGGKGFITGFGCPGFRPMMLPCEFCNQTGELSDEWDYRPEDGARIRRARKDREETMRTVAKRRKVSVVIVSHEERGYFRKEER